MSRELSEKLAGLRLVGFDVDGVFTDGSLYFSDDGSESKRFNTQDGYGIRRLLDAGIEVVVISGRRSAAVERRMGELGISRVVLGSKDKVADFDELIAPLSIDATECAYVGDDVPDLALMTRVGVAIGVANAHPDIHSECDWITTHGGGRGAIREICDAILAARRERGGDTG